MSDEVDKAQEAVERFKRQGYFDKIKQDILNKQLYEESNLSVQEMIRDKVGKIVKDMVSEDENLIFKNRGSTSALIEAQIFKDGYKKLQEGENGIKLDEYIDNSLSDKILLEDIKSKLYGLIEEEKSN
ncbi:hypothetical protein Kpol_1066p7 [Vanderwaltozyma polyspora DSM 70294]|uniref:BOD1/SHG1 domain-containing protein n=1 Tax=Vanderwaltozyma polyspora (strain ATCC 22028 / DSM 70294 / BCRC 21397 / CBS 2163 / NBRC 10782 / NRRL Y-8283 / UCD 57-17) TaxID=436907 RepID=A7TMM9_VANPO|nr:uncharacterized protein Kpol_1066p7 [Vanderwaltozyma polyspora DSM 70294]EDO16443.1 hypothetical protein Kpol_1066p7 [Vanderwaltozyma polyspora DSM 70294]